MILRSVGKPSVALGIAAALFTCVFPADAETRAAYRVTRLPAVILPGGGKVDGAVAELDAYDILMTASLGYSRVARLDGPIDVTIAGQHVIAASGDALPAVRATGGVLGEAGQTVYCLVPHEAPRGAHLAREIQPCFVDRDGDLDAVFLVGARRHEDMAPVPLSAPYEEQTDVPIPGASIEIVYHRNLEGFAIQLVAHGRPFVITRVRFGDGEWVSSHADIGSSAYPRTVSIGSARIEVVSYDRRAHHVRARVIAPFERSEIDFEYPSDSMTIVIPVVR
jgi:hypothetical protein